MNLDHLQQFINLRRMDIDPEVFAAALAIRHINMLIINGGGSIGRPDLESVLHPHQLEVFLDHAISTAQKTKRFEHEWRRMREAIPGIKVAWEKGQALFQENLARVMGNPEEMEYLSQIDFAENCYAYVTALKTYPHDQALQAWTINAYMQAWQQHFLNASSE